MACGACRSYRSSEQKSVSQRSATVQETRDPEWRYRRIVEAAEEGIITIDANALTDFVNPKMARMLGYGAEQILGRPLTDFMDDEGRRLFALYLQRLQQGVTQQFDFKVRCQKGEELWVNVSANPLLDVQGQYDGALAMFTDIRERREAEHLLAWEKGALETIGGATTLGEVLEELMLGLERHLPDALCSVLLVDDDGLHLRHGAAPSLPDEYNRLVDGFPVGSSSGSCGTAVHTGRQIIVSDIASDPLWRQIRDEALAHGLRACWSTPVSDGTGKIIATFAVY